MCRRCCCCSPYAYVDPLAACLSTMFVTMFKDALTEYTYDAELAGLDYSLSNTLYGLSVGQLPLKRTQDSAL